MEAKNGAATVGAMFGSPSPYQPEGKHWGWDVWAAPGTPVRALRPYRVILSREDDGPSGFWQWIIVEYDDCTCQLHGHLQKGSIPPVGKRGKRGDAIGTVGTLKDATPPGGSNSTPHSHTQFFKNREDALAIPRTHNLSLDPEVVRKRYGESLPVKRSPGWATPVGSAAAHRARYGDGHLDCGCGSGEQDVDYSSQITQVEWAEGF